MEDLSSEVGNLDNAEAEDHNSPPPHQADELVIEFYDPDAVSQAELIHL